MSVKYVVTSVTYKADGSTQNFSIPFEYLSKSHVKVLIDGIKYLTNFTFLSAYVVRLGYIPNAGTSITVQRETPFEQPEIVWSDGTIIIADDMNVQTLQLLYILQERKDPYNLNTKDLDAYFDVLKGSMPCPFGRFSVTSDGRLLLDVFGTVPPESLTINSDGHLILETMDA